MDIKVLSNDREFACVSYVINGMLIDAGSVPKTPVQKIILTHCHFDHVLYANVIKEKFNVEVYASEKCAKHLEEIDQTVDVFSEFSNKKLSRIKVDVVVKEGDTIDNLTVLETPGHTDGSICLWDEKENIMFTGDTLFHNGVGRTDLPTGDEEKLSTSLERIKNINPRLIYPGH